MSAPVRVGSLCTGYGGIEMGLRLAGVDVDTRWVSETEPSLAPVLGDDIPNHGKANRRVRTARTVPGQPAHQERSQRSTGGLDLDALERSEARK